MTVPLFHLALWTVCGYKRMWTWFLQFKLTHVCLLNTGVNIHQIQHGLRYGALQNLTWTVTMLKPCWNYSLDFLPNYHLHKREYNDRFYQLSLYVIRQNSGTAYNSTKAYYISHFNTSSLVHKTPSSNLAYPKKQSHKLQYISYFHPL